MKSYGLAYRITKLLHEVDTSLNFTMISEKLYRDNKDHYSSLESCKQSVMYSLGVLEDMCLVKKIPNPFRRGTDLWCLTDYGSKLMQTLEQIRSIEESRENQVTSKLDEGLSAVSSSFSA